MSASTATPPSDPILDRMEDQIDWYDRKSRSNMQWYKRMKMTEIISAAVIPFVGTIHMPSAITGTMVTGALGVLITVLEGLLQLNKYHENWISYRATCESLKHEKYMFLAGATAYATAERPRQLLAERTEALISQEGAKWASVQLQAPKSASDTDGTLR